ncbi:MAG TPA: sigma-70 family RNA polymerase sigma factor [Terriglobales bacterium]|nr:sigma-70 family RNA polymerase sigma factor [Terriglobales bacterium]
MEKAVAGATTVGDLAGAFPVRAEEASILAELRSGSEDAYAWLIAHYHQPVYSLVYRMLSDPADAADTTQEVFIKVFRGIKRFNGQASLKTWIYRIAIHEASNQRRWWFRHKRREHSMDAPLESHGQQEGRAICLQDSLVDAHESPFDHVMHEEVRAAVEAEVRQVPEPYRTTLVLRDIEGLSYEEIAEVLEVSLGTVKSRLIRGREALRKRLFNYVQLNGPELGLQTAKQPERTVKSRAKQVSKVEVETGR